MNSWRNMLLTAAAFSLAGAAFAQSPLPDTATLQRAFTAAQSQIADCNSIQLNLRMQLLAANETAEKLQKEIEALKTPKPVVPKLK